MRYVLVTLPNVGTSYNAAWPIVDESKLDAAAAKAVAYASNAALRGGVGVTVRYTHNITPVLNNISLPLHDAVREATRTVPPQSPDFWKEQYV